MGALGRSAPADSAGPSPSDRGGYASLDVEAEEAPAVPALVRVSRRGLSPSCRSALHADRGHFPRWAWTAGVLMVVSLAVGATVWLGHAWEGQPKATPQAAEENQLFESGQAYSPPTTPEAWWTPTTPQPSEQPRFWWTPTTQKPDAAPQPASAQPSAGLDSTKTLALHSATVVPSTLRTTSTSPTTMPPPTTPSTMTAVSTTTLTSTPQLDTLPAFRDSADALAGGLTRFQAVTTTTLTTTQRIVPPELTDVADSLFCFMLIVPDSYEMNLVKEQIAKWVGIFQCEEHSVFSDAVIELSQGPPNKLVTEAIDGGSVKAKLGGEFYTALNSEVFVRVWKKVFMDRRFERHGWTVKCDADAVFFPQRLREHIFGLPMDESAYLNNCKAGLHGPIEVLTLGGMKAYREGIDRCLSEKVADFNKWGEDVFLRRCLALLHVREVKDYDLLSEKHCFEDPSPCVARQKVVFHPFKTPESYFKCHGEASGADSDSFLMGRLQ